MNFWAFNSHFLCHKYIDCSNIFSFFTHEIVSLQATIHILAFYLLVSQQLETNFRCQPGHAYLPMYVKLLKIIHNCLLSTKEHLIKTRQYWIRKAGMFGPVMPNIWKSLCRTIYMTWFSIMWHLAQLKRHIFFSKTP